MAERRTKRRKPQPERRVQNAFSCYARELSAAITAAAERIRRSRRRMSRVLREVEEQLVAVNGGFEQVVHELGTVLDDMSALSAAKLETAPVRVLDADPAGRLSLDGSLLEIESFDEKRRWLTTANLGGRLLIDVVRGRSLDEWDSSRLAKAIQQVRRAPAIGKTGLTGRGRQIRLELACRLGPRLTGGSRLRHRAGSAARV